MSIRLENVRKSFGKPPTDIIKDVSLEIKAGEFVSLTGKSGSGKSTLLYLISSLDDPTQGKVHIDGKDLASLPPKELHMFRNRHMGFVFQFHYLLPEFTSLENVLMPALKAGVREEKKKDAIELLERFGLGDKLDHIPSQLSGGQMQRVSIARALVMRPRYLFADEPTGALDSANAKIVMDIFKNINKQDGTTVIMVTHDPDFAKSAKRQIHLIDGKISKEKAS
ncbi:ABC transporter ATP-binding protein [Leptospira wolffii]|uniref:ABC transporter ATP-binding protein n=1 Tax=Leptospira wolffii TaxID=409998 RepID=UPI001084584B|nr:ABC transporter ATP-binding protein [Leptospira wolffii]TGK58215.1 ABC transporter ATP-binding protein [Leptospira wolffii]TGK66409.1 ABC transporter ATP-binding protein [Leptospira wolffii]TGK68893.1 ABC transporter ATP-binding protein [Leptospira wolffii]TGL27245.1 ABC transporter ATP-binding protein [Leptospira wolffii]